MIEWEDGRSATLLDVVKAIQNTPLNATTKGVALALLRHADFDTWECFPKVKTLAAYAGVGERTAHRALDILREHGLIDWRNQYRDDGSKRSSHYTLDIEAWRDFDVDEVPLTAHAPFMLPRSPTKQRQQARAWTAKHYGRLRDLWRAVRAYDDIAKVLRKWVTDVDGVILHYEAWSQHQSLADARKNEHPPETWSNPDYWHRLYVLLVEYLGGWDTLHALGLPAWDSDEMLTALLAAMKHAPVNAFSKRHDALAAALGLSLGSHPSPARCSRLEPLQEVLRQALDLSGGIKPTHAWTWDDAAAIRLLHDLDRPPMAGMSVEEVAERWWAWLEPRVRADREGYDAWKAGGKQGERPASSVPEDWVETVATSIS